MMKELAGYLWDRAGDRIVSVNALKDELIASHRDRDVSIVIRKRDGREEAYEVEKDPRSPLGVVPRSGV